MASNTGEWPTMLEQAVVSCIRVTCRIKPAPIKYGGCIVPWMRDNLFNGAVQFQYLTLVGARYLEF